MRASYFTDIAVVMLLVLSVLLAPSSHALQKTVTQTDYKEVGRGEMDWWWFALYQAKLSTPSGQYHYGHYPLILEIEYYREIDSRDLIEATLQQWQLLGVDQTQRVNWREQLVMLWPNVKPGDNLSFHVASDGRGQFYFNNEPLEQKFETSFSKHFIDIWLAENTSRPKLRAQLIGEQACDC